MMSPPTPMLPLRGRDDSGVTGIPCHGLCYAYFARRGGGYRAVFACGYRGEHEWHGAAMLVGLQALRAIDPYEGRSHREPVPAWTTLPNTDYKLIPKHKPPVWREGDRDVLLDLR